MRLFSFAVALLTVVSPQLKGDSLEVSLKEGDKAPAFAAMDANGQVWKSEDHVGKKLIVVYFYPADLTSGCTAQACAYRDHMRELEEAGVEVVGVSGDTVNNHQLFTRVHALNFPLLCDEQGKVAGAFGVPVRDGATLTRMVDGVEQKLTRGVTASRWTFIIGKDGRIIRKCTAVEAADDCKKVLETVRRLTADIE